MLANRSNRRMSDEKGRTKEPCRTNVGWRQPDSEDNGGGGGGKRREGGEVMCERKDEMGWIVE